MIQALRRLFSKKADEPAPRRVRVRTTLLGQPFWNERGANGEVTCTSHPETFTRREDAVRAAKDHCAAKRIFVEE